MNVIMAEPAKWDSFYVIVWSAAGALIGLQFIVLTLIAQRSLHKGAMKTGAAFATPTIVHFGVSLLLSALLRASWQKIGIFAAVLSFIGFSGVAYVGIIALRIIREKVYHPVPEGLAVSFCAAFGRLRSTCTVSIRGTPPNLRESCSVLELLCCCCF